MLNWEDMRSVDFLIKSGFIPIGKGIVDLEESGNVRGGRVCIGITRVTTNDGEIFGIGKGKEQTKDWLFNTRRIGLGQGMKTRSGTRRAIAAVAGAAFTIRFDTVLPLGIE
jgi:hypothetical protein